MTTTKSEQIFEEICTRISAITRENGYQSDIGNNLHRGWLASLIHDDDQTFPVIAVQRGPVTVNNRNGLTVKETMAVDLVAAVRGLDDSGRDLYRIVYDIKRALWTSARGLADIPGVLEVQFGSAEPNLWPDGKTKLSFIAVPVEIAYTETFPRP
ncbi:hypothetical protein [Parendozoicomonas sp. Alg238-R29]|uniref:hypothetical protein n=1 Tax=Parendozoicomonas sp. Alg238-R29 TaxID=2993446 RepID=UPI00248DA529|nr:hypothetical protein [Parendozoicomonas sp. Alg238-R29]